MSGSACKAPAWCGTGNTSEMMAPPYLHVTWDGQLGYCSPGCRDTDALTTAHVRSWLQAHPDAYVGPSGDWELPAVPVVMDSLIREVHEAMQNAPHDGLPYRQARAAVAAILARFDVRPKP